jgi:uncharacterized membrane protein
MATGYILMGILHFVITADLIRIVPPYIPFPAAMVALSGVAEISLGLALFFKKTRHWACYGIILLLFAVLPANIYMLTSGGEFGVPHWVLLGRLPLQGVLMLWAYWHSREGSGATENHSLRFE